MTICSLSIYELLCSCRFVTQERFFYKRSDDEEMEDAGITMQLCMMEVFAVVTQTSTTKIEESAFASVWYKNSIVHLMRIGHGKNAYEWFKRRTLTFVEPSSTFFKIDVVKGNRKDASS